MSDDKALMPIEEKQVDFYGDALTAVLVNVEGQDVVYVPLRPLSDYLGLKRISLPGRLSWRSSPGSGHFGRHE